MGFMVLNPNNYSGHQTDVASEKGQEYQAVRIFGKDKFEVCFADLANFEVLRRIPKIFPFYVDVARLDAGIY